jgi:hypothetical protein
MPMEIAAKREQVIGVAGRLFTPLRARLSHLSPSLGIVSLAGPKFLRGP